MTALDGADGGSSCARHRRERRMRSFWGHEQFAVRCAVVAATHHSANQAKRVDAETQTVKSQAAGPHSAGNISERIMEQTVDAPVREVMEGIVESEYVAPAPAVARRRLAGKSVASVPAVTFSARAPAPVI